MPSNAPTKPGSGKAKSKIITLRLSSASLDRFPSDKPSDDATDSKNTPSVDLSTMDATPSALDDDSKVPSTPEPNGTPAPADGDATPTNGEDGLGGPKTGAKRSAAAADGLPKQRGRPGPKKKARVGELINGEVQRGSSGGHGGHKLGPKANQGAINAGLRALDRSGKPCRKWERKGFSVKSFTGVIWEVPTWRAPKKTVNLDANGEVKSDTSSEMKGDAINTSVLPSENGTSGSNSGTPLPMAGVASSPAPVAAA